MRKIMLVLLSVWTTIGVNHHASAQLKQLEVEYKSSSLFNIVGSIHDDVENAMNVESVKSWGSYLYITGRYVNGDQKLEVWDVRNPANPVMVQSLDYGNLDDNPQNHYEFPYVNVFDDVVIIRSNLLDYIYHPDESGQLVLESINDFGSEVGEILNQEMSFRMSSAASYGTYHGRLFDPYEVEPEEEYGYLILNFTNPRRPFVATLVNTKDVVYLTDQFVNHLNGALGNNPAVIWVTDDNMIRLAARKIKSDSHIDVFWEPRITRIFNEQSIQRSIRGQIEEVIDNHSINARLSEAIDGFFEGLELASEVTVRENILNHYEPVVKLVDLLNEYDIDGEDSLRLAIKKIISEHLVLAIEKELSHTLYSHLFNDWMDSLFQIPTNVSRNGFEDSISTILNDGLSAETVGRFLLDNYVAPLAEEDENLEWMFWTMDELVDEVVNSDAGQAVSVIIGTAHETVTLGGLLELALGFIPEAEQFLLPAGFPEDCRDVLECAFYEHGAGLNPDGLAFIELMKYSQYFNGNDDYLDYELQFSDALQQLQTEYAGALTETIEPFMAAQSFVGDIQERIGSFSTEIPCQEEISLAITDAIAARLEANGIDVDRSIHDVFLDYQLYLEQLDTPNLSLDELSQVEDLVNVLENDLNEGQTRIQELWNEGKQYSQHIETAYRRALTQAVHEAWGNIDIDRTIHSGLRDFLGNHIDARWTFGENMDELINDFVFSCLTDYPGFLDHLELIERAADGDVLARWQITFKTAKEAAALAEPTQTLSTIFESIELSVEEAFQQGLAGTARSLLYQYAMTILEDMYGNHSGWVSRTDQISFSFNIDDFTSLDPIRSEAFVWENQIILVTREEWDFINPRQVAMTVFDPYNPDTSKMEAVLGGHWHNVDYVHSYKGTVMLGGSKTIDSFITPVATFLSLDDDQVTSHTIQDYRLASSEGMLKVNHGAHLVLYGPGGVFLLPNPSTISPPEQKTDIRNWVLY